MSLDLIFQFFEMTAAKYPTRIIHQNLRSHFYFDTMFLEWHLESIVRHFESYYFNLTSLWRQLDVVSMTHHINDLFCIHVFLYDFPCFFRLYVFMCDQGFPPSCMFKDDCIDELRFLQHTTVINMKTVSLIHHMFRYFPKDLGDWRNFFFSKQLWTSITSFHFVIIILWNIR